MITQVKNKMWEKCVCVCVCRHLCEAVSARYLTSQRRGQKLKILAEYFLGRWSGKLKPVALPGLSLLLSDRKVQSTQHRASSRFWRVKPLQKCLECALFVIAIRDP